MKNRTGKQVRDRFLNSLAPGVNKKRFTLEEDKKILKYYKIYGKSWSVIAKFITGRTGDMIKNRFYSNLSKIYKKEKFQKDEIIEEEKSDNQNSESDKNDSTQDEKNDIIIDLQQNNTSPNNDNNNQQLPFSTINNTNNINNNPNVNINNNFYFMNNFFTPALIPNFLFPNLTKENMYELDIKSSLGWDDKLKRKEMEKKDGYYIIFEEGFVCIRFEVDGILNGVVN